MEGWQTGNNAGLFPFSLIFKKLNIVEEEGGRLQGSGRFFGEFTFAQRAWSNAAALMHTGEYAKKQLQGK